MIEANGLPDHATGRFPNAGNPNRIRAQSYRFTVPLRPQPASQPTPLRMQAFGIALNGVVFDPGAAEWYDRERQWQYEPLNGGVDLGIDDHHAHVQPTGAYHYHGLPVGLIQTRSGGRPAMVLLGWAADGFPIYGPWDHQQPGAPASPLVRLRSSYRLKAGDRPAGAPPGAHDGTFVADHEYVAGSGDLDECNGRWGPTPEFPDGIYHYHLTADFPFIPRQFRGTPDPSFERHGPPGGGPPPGGRPPHPGGLLELGPPPEFGPPRRPRPPRARRD